MLSKNIMYHLVAFSIIFSYINAAPSQLMIAAQQGNTAECLQLLHNGVNVNEQDNSGKSALHYAVQHGHAYLAALLLTYEADHTIADRSGKKPLTVPYTTLETIHAIRQHYQRLPAKNYISVVDPSIAPYLETFTKNGIVKISGLISPEELKQLKNDFETFVQRIESERAQGRGLYTHYDDEEYFKPKDDIYVTNNAFKYSSQLAKLCCNPILNSLAYHYLQKPAYIQRAQGMRYPPGGRMGTIQFKWHHDMDDKRFKIMILLTDVGEKDQYMTYVLKSQSIFHPYQRFLTNDLDFEYCKKHVDVIDIFKATGKAGDIFLFDSNGMHSGNRSNGKTRDVFIIEYTADNNNIWGGKVSQDIVNTCIALNNMNPFEKMLAVKQNKWEIQQEQRRKATSWSTSLLTIDAWL